MRAKRSARLVRKQKCAGVHLHWLSGPDQLVPATQLVEQAQLLRLTQREIVAVSKVGPDALQDDELTGRLPDEPYIVRRAGSRQDANDGAGRQVVRNFSRATSAMVTSSPSRSLRCSPRSSGLSLSDVPLRLESTMK